MKKIFLFFFLFVCLLHGYTYDDLLLRAQSSIFPKIMILDKKIVNKVINGKIIYTIVYANDDYQKALDIKKYINRSFKGYIGTYAYKVNLIEFSKLSNAIQTSAFYVLKSSKENIYKVANIARKKGVLTFSYDINNLKNGLAFSLVIERSTLLYLNEKHIDITKIDFIDSLLQMIKFIE